MYSRIAMFVLGAAVALVVVAVIPAGEGPPAAPGGEVAELRAKNDDLSQRVDGLAEKLEAANAELETLRSANEPAAAPAPIEISPPSDITPPADSPEEPVAEDSTTPVSDKEVMDAVKDFGPALGSIITGDGEAAVKRLRSVLDRADPAQIAKLVEMYGETGDLGRKIVIAHALAQSGRPEAIDALKEMVRDQTRTFDDRRFVAHGLAFANDPDLKPILLDVARTDPDRGVRANAAFGVARTGSDEGLDLYAKATDEAFREKDPVALQYLSGFALLGKRAMPAVRERVETYTDPQSRLVLIQLLQANKDEEALPALHRLDADPGTDPAVRAAARKAIQEIEKQE